MILEEQVVKALKSDASGSGRELLQQYAAQCEQEANTKVASDPNDPRLPNRANLESDFKIARVYAQVPGLKTEALEALEDLRLAASQQDSTLYLIPEIDALIALIPLVD
jgi:HPt (histidine-containing phosphotransfer) domain-containing protein